MGTPETPTDHANQCELSSQAMSLPQVQMMEAVLAEIDFERVDMQTTHRVVHMRLSNGINERFCHVAEASALLPLHSILQI